MHAIEIITHKPGNARRGALPRLRPESYPSSVAELVLPRPRPLRPLPTLPPEILIIIMNHVEERPALVRCCLAAKALLAPARAELYRTLELDSNVPEPAKALDAIANSPHLAPLVRKLELIRPPDITPAGSWDLGALERLLVRALDILPRVEEVDMNGVYFAMRGEGAAALFNAVAAGRRDLRVISVGAVIHGTQESDQRRLAAIGNFLRQQTGGMEELRLVASLDADIPPPGPPPTFELLTLDYALIPFAPRFLSFVTASSRNSLRSLTLGTLTPLPPSSAPDLSVFANLESLLLHGTLGPWPDLPSHLSSLPLRHCSLNDPSIAAEPLLRNLPSTLETASLRTVPPSAVIDFLNSGACPALTSLFSSPSTSSQRWNPFSITAVAVACARRGLRLVQNEPLELGGTKSDENARRDPTAGMRPLESYWR